MTNQALIEDFRLVAVPDWRENPLVWLGLALGLAASAYFLRRWLRARPLPLKRPKPAPPGPPAHVEALNRLRELRARHARLTAYEVALECSDILRRFIEGRFQSPIRYQTTREFLGAARAGAELDPESREELGGFLEFFDGLKFARETAAPERTAQAIDGAERFVRRCLPGEVPEA
jgi:hypothetical protein